MGGGSKALLEVWKALLDLFLRSFGYQGKMELVQILIRIYAVGEKADALPLAHGGSAF
jgi:hypothetical protein